ncbi:protein SMG9-like [Phoenix dactylifera]|uniref:Protein SMG9-like n=1 Tax=Phoenix dactylifera TaxID=42345 RepID=A0A8B7CNW0_PHODC|nr:protein SMG9-like [Phoenix dactylifera]XP_008803230.1 protein SMG9-like [Phoenix dactylifera]XP_038972655.1 protein SMG9-like [Phoenix dactylifera]
MAGGAPPSTGGPPTTSSFSSVASSSLASGLPPPPPPPKILLAKPGSGPAAPRFPRDDDPSGSVVLRSRNAPQPSSLNLLSDSWEFHTDRILPFLTENNDFTVVGIIGPPGVGKSTIMNDLYGFDGSSPGMLPPFATQSDETRAMAKHCTTGIELRVSAERLILLDAQPMFSPSLLVDMMRPDGSSTIPLLNGESLSADLAHELMGIQLGVFLASICNVLLVVSEGIHDFSMWQLMLVVDLLKHGIPDPSLLTSSHSQGSDSVPDNENKSIVQPTSVEFLSALVFIHTKLQDQDLSPSKTILLRKALLQFFSSSSFNVNKHGATVQTDSSNSLDTKSEDLDPVQPDLFMIPLKWQDNVQKSHSESYCSMSGKLRDQILSMTGHSFAKNISERDWLRNSAKIWELVKKSPVIVDYCRTLQSSGLFRK